MDSFQRGLSQAPSGSGSSGHNRIRVVLLADQALFRASLGRLLASEPGLDLLGECATAEEALTLVNSEGGDVLLLETENTGEFIGRATRSGFEGKFLVIASEADARSSAIALKQGAAGIFLKTDSASRLLQAIRMVADGEMWVDPAVVRLLADRCPVDEARVNADGLTDREQRVLLGILGGLSNRKIGESMKLSEGSVKATVQQLFEKTGVRTRSQLVRIAMERSLGATGELAQRGNLTISH